MNPNAIDIAQMLLNNSFIFYKAKYDSYGVLPKTSLNNTKSSSFR